MITASDEPSSHYDRVTQAWTLLLGEDLHYGLFAADESLAVATAALTDLMAELACLAPYLAILDVGCGTGHSACSLAETYRCRVTGISTSQTGIALANARARRRGLEGSVSFVMRDGMNTGFPDASFDRVWVMESSHLMPQKERLIAETFRLVQPGGVVALCDVIVQRKLAFGEVLRHGCAFDLLRRVYGRAKMETLDFYAEQLIRHGLEVTARRDISIETRPTFARWRANALTHRQEVTDLIGDAAWSEFVASCDVLDDFWELRLLGYGAIAARRP